MLISDKDCICQFVSPKANHVSVVKSIMKSPLWQKSLVPMSFYKAAQGKQLDCL